VLNVSTNSQSKEIKQAYYQLAKKYHPDTFLSNSQTPPTEDEYTKIDQKFKSITEAYSILSDQDKRKQYDRLIFGDAADTPRNFDNQEAYDYW
jgi:DnaJ-class molecular chaperone